jgi:Short C-terminal domain
MGTITKSFAIVGVALVVSIAAVFISMQRSQGSSRLQGQMAALKQLRDTGVISAQEYDSKVLALRASSPAPSAEKSVAEKLAALKGLRDTGVITAKEYESKVAAVRASSPVTTPAKFVRPASATRRVEVTDSQYGMTAATLEIPADWKFAGTIARPPGCHGHGASLKFTAQSPDGLTAVVALPGVAWDWAASETIQKSMEQAHCPAIDIDSAASFLVNIAVPNIQPDAKIVGVLPLDAEGQAVLKDQLDKEIQQNASMGNFKQVNPKWTLDGANVRVQYVREGHPVEEMITAVVHCNEQTMPAMAMLKQSAYQKRTCFSRGTTIVRAPQGHLDELLALPQIKLGKTMQPNADWQSRLAADQMAAFQKGMADNNRRYNDFQKQIDANNRQFAANQQQFKEQGEQRLAAGRAFQERQADSFNHAMANDRQRQAAIDASAHATALYSLDRQEFRNPNTGQVIEASNQYSHQWISSDGSTLIQTNDHTYDPNGQVYPVSQSWSELVVK